MLIIFAFIIIFLLENSYQSFYTKRCLQCPQMKSFQLKLKAPTHFSIILFVIASFERMAICITTKSSWKNHPKGCVFATRSNSLT